MKKYVKPFSLNVTVENEPSNFSQFAKGFAKGLSGGRLNDEKIEVFNKKEILHKE